MREVSTGDIFSLSRALECPLLVWRSLTVLSALSQPSSAPGGEYWERVGWKVLVQFTSLQHRVRPKDHIEVLKPLLPPKYGPPTAQRERHPVNLSDRARATSCSSTGGPDRRRSTGTTTISAPIRVTTTWTGGNTDWRPASNPTAITPEMPKHIQLRLRRVAKNFLYSRGCVAHGNAAAGWNLCKLPRNCRRGPAAARTHGNLLQEACEIPKSFPQQIFRTRKCELQIAGFQGDPAVVQPTSG